MKGKVALVTGAANGIGESIARALLESGAIVVAVDSNREKLEMVIDELKQMSYQIFGYIEDVSNGNRIETLVERIEKEIGPVEFLINVAGVLQMGLITSITDQEWERTFLVNTTGVFNLCRSVSKRMITRKKGSIVTISSNAGSIPRMSMAAYSASKAATIMFMKCLALELAQYNIRCNIVSPGSTDTEMQRIFSENGKGKERVIQGELEKYRIGIPLKKIAKTSDISGAVMFLLSNKAGHITMNNLCIDGGATLGVQ